ncbi:ROK family protein [Bacillus sp. UMB0728]|jgi:predicted NBD/HSP70 family sugar kinase|nr:ROK family protein [Bacillus sp. UMB0728]
MGVEALRNYAAFDVGGSSIKYALMDESGSIIKKSSIPTPKEGIEAFIEAIGKAVEEIRFISPVEGIAMSMPGAVDVVSGTIHGASAVPYVHGPNIRELVEKRTGLPAELENDANCAGLAEGWIGAAKDVQDYICIVIGTGIGGAIVLDKKVRHGASFHGGEFGYMIMEDYLDKPLGRSWSDLGATGALVNIAAARKGMDPDTLDGRKVFEMAEGGDKEIQEEIERFFKRLAVGILNLHYIIDPEKILIGGAISGRHDFCGRINRVLSSMKSDIHSLDVKAEVCRFGNDSNLIGALYHFLQCQKAKDKVLDIR